MNFIGIKCANFFLFRYIIIYAIFKPFGTICGTQFNNCNKDSFRCTTGTCINKRLICDGIKHCLDGSDETSGLCNAQKCPSYMFRCNYGACVKISSICNKVADCVDGSDEPPINNCKVPNYIPYTSSTPLKTTALPSTQTTKIYTPFRPTSASSPSPPTYPTYSTKKPSSQGTKSPLVPPTPANFKGCILPNPSSYNLRYDVTCSSSDCRNTAPGSVVPHATILSFQCNNGYIYDLNQESESVCIKDKWRPPISQCKKICKKLKSDNILIKCTYQQTNVDCTTDLRAGTVITPQCLPGYSPASTSYYNEITCLDNGEWDAPLFSCIPTKNVPTPAPTKSTEGNNLPSTELPPPGSCQLPQQYEDKTYTINDCSTYTNGTFCDYQPGQYVPIFTTIEFQCRQDYYSNLGERTTAFCVDGGWAPSITNCDECGITNTNTGLNENYIPWLAAIYDSNTNAISCWGTIVSQYSILTAAHCILDESNNRKAPSDIYAVIGKRLTTENEDSQTRRFRIAGISLLDESFRGAASNYGTNLALIETDTKITFDNGIKPVCADFKNHFNLRPHDGTLGMVPIWVVDRYTTTSTLQPQQFPYISNSQCRTMASSEFRSFITDDKFCIHGVSITQGIGVNAGNGYFLNRDGRKNLYIFGVMSTHFMDSNNIPVFIITDINRYMGKIKSMNDDIDARRKIDQEIDTRFSDKNSPTKQTPK